MALAAGIAFALSDIVEAENVVFAPHQGGDLRKASMPCFPPDAIVYLGDTAEVAQVPGSAAACDVTVRAPDLTVLREGDAGEIVPQLSRWDHVVDIDRDTLTVRIQPAIHRDRLLRRLGDTGTVPAGAQNPSAGGTPPRLGAEFVLAVVAVSATGTVIRADLATPGGVDVIDLLLRKIRLPCVITEVTLALLPRLCEIEG